MINTIKFDKCNYMLNNSKHKKRRKKIPNKRNVYDFRRHLQFKMLFAKIN